MEIVEEWQCPNPECGAWESDERFCCTCGLDRWDEDNIKVREVEKMQVIRWIRVNDEATKTIVRSDLTKEEAENYVNSREKWDNVWYQII